MYIIEALQTAGQNLWLWTKRLSRASAIDFGLRNLGSVFYPLCGFAFRVAMLLVFFWYVLEFVWELGPRHSVIARIVTIGAAALALAFLVAVVRASVSFDPNTKTQPASVLPFVLLNLIPIAIVAFATWWKDDANFHFHYDLLNFTQAFLRKIVKGLLGQ